MQQYRRGQLLLVLAISLPAIALVASLPARPLIMGVINDAAHGPVFAMLAVVLYLLLRQNLSWQPPASLAGAFGLALTAGAAVELIQPLLGRDASLSDLVTDAWGASAGLSLTAWYSRKEIRVLRLPGVGLLMAGIFLLSSIAVLAPVAAATTAYWHRETRFPIILDGNDAAVDFFLVANRLKLQRMSLPSQWRSAEDGISLKLTFLDGLWPGLEHREPPSNWTGHQSLLLDLTNPSAAAFKLTLRVHDQQHDKLAHDRYNRSFVLLPESRRVIRIPLSEIETAPSERRLDLSQIAGLILFTNGETDSNGRDIYLTRVWLE